MGHSQGGVVASMLAGLYHDQIGRVVLFAPAVTLVDDARQGTCMGVAYDPDHVPEMLQIGPNEVGGHYFRIAQSLPVLETASRFRGPVFFAIGAADEIVDPGSVNRWKSIYKDAEFHVIPDMNRQRCPATQARYLFRSFSTSACPSPYSFSKYPSYPPQVFRMFSSISRPIFGETPCCS